MLILSETMQAKDSCDLSTLVLQLFLESLDGGQHRMKISRAARFFIRRAELGLDAPAWLRAPGGLSSRNAGGGKGQ